MKIVVTKQNKGYRACVEGRPDTWAPGPSYLAAIGSLVAMYPGVFGLEFEDSEGMHASLAGTASCGCVHHAEESIPCEHDYAQAYREVRARLVRECGEELVFHAEGLLGREKMLRRFERHE